MSLRRLPSKIAPNSPNGAGRLALGNDRLSRSGPSWWKTFGVALFVSLLFALGSTYLVWQHRATEYDSAARAEVNTARLVAADVGKTFEQLDVLLRSIGRQYADGLRVGPDEKARLEDRMKEEIADYPVVARLQVIGPSGLPLLQVGEYVRRSSTTDLSDRAYFRQAAAGDRGLIFEGPIKSKFADEWVIVVARRIEGSGGDFLGVVSAAIPVASFTKLFATVDAVKRGVVALWTDAGVLVARYTPEPGGEVGIGAKTWSEAARRLLREHPEQDHGVYQSVSSVDGVERLFAYQKLAKAPFLVIVGRPKAGLDASWRRLASELGLAGVVLTAGAFWSARALRRSALRLADENQSLERRVAERSAEIEAQNRALGANELKFREAMAAAPSPIALFDATGRFIEVNAALCDALGYSRDEMLALDIRALVAPGDAPPDPAVARRLAAGELKTFRTERRYLRKDGRAILFEVATSAARSPSGEVLYFIGQAHDVTAKVELERHQRLLQDVIDKSPYGIAVFDENRNCVVINENYGRILQLPAAVLAQKPFKADEQLRFCYDRGDFGFEKSREEVVESILRDMETNAARRSERRLNNGLWIAFRGDRLLHNHMMATYLDITGYKSVEQDLREAKERLEAAAAAGVIGVWTIEVAEGGRITWDGMQRRLYGLPETDFEITAEVFLGMVHPDDRAEVASAFQRGFKGQRNPALEFRIVRPDGALRYLRGFSQTIRGPDGKPSRVVGVTYDVTEQKETQHALEQASARAEAASKAKSLFLANISHEIRTPLNAIAGMTQILAHTTLDAEQAACVRTLDSAGHNVLVLLSDILDLSRIESGRLELSETPFSLAEVIQGVADTFSVTANAKGLALRMEALPGDLPRLLGDPIRLGQVLTNLVGNAVKFTAEGGVTVSVAMLERGTETVRVRVQVRDTGIGIGAAQIGALFEPFVQADRTTQERFGGTGLGLAIAKRIVERMDGEIGVESVPGEGSLFWFVVAFRIAPAEDMSRSEPTGGKGAPRLDGVRILIVDDAETNRDIAAKLLTLQGAACRTAVNGREAVELLRADPGAFDCVFMDVQMPEMDGIEATRAIRQELGLVNLPVIALTAGAMESQREEALASGMNAFVAKPFRLRGLVAAVSPFVGGRSGQGVA